MNPSSSLPSVVRLEPVCRYLFRRVVVIPALAGLSLFAALPAFAQTAGEPTTKTDSGSFGPVVSIVKPEFSDVLKDTVQIVIAVAPRSYPAQSVELLVDGKAVSGVLPIQNKFNWKTNLFKDGQHTLTVRVTDTQGFIGQAETRIFISNTPVKTADTLAPVLNWLNVKNGQELSGEVTVRLSAKDDFGVKYVFLRLNSAITPDNKGGLASWMTNRPPYEFKLDTNKFEDGEYVFDAYAWDASNNEENAPRVTVRFTNHSLNPIIDGAPSTSELVASAATNPTAETGDVGTTTASQASQIPKNTDGSSLPNFPAQKITNLGDIVIHDTPSPHQPPKPMPPAVASFIVTPRNGAAQSSALPSVFASDLPREDWISNSEQASRPDLGMRAEASIRPPVANPIVVNPKVESPKVEISKTEIQKTENPKAENPKINTINPQPVKSAPIPTPPRFVETPPVPSQPETPAAWTVLSDPSVLPSSTPVQPATSVSGTRTQRNEIFEITPPTTAPRHEQLPEQRITQRVTGASTSVVPAITIAGEDYAADGASVPRKNSELTRIAAVLPGELSTTPSAQDVWHQPRRTIVDTSARALLTTVQTLPKTNVTAGRGASLEVEKNHRVVALTTSPPAPQAAKPPVVKAVMRVVKPQPQTPVVKAVMAETPLSKPVALLAVPHQPSTLRAAHEAAQVKITAPHDVKIPVKVVPVKVPAKNPTEALPVPVVNKSIHVESKPIGRVPSLPTPPRIAMSPDIKPNAAPHRFNAAIVVAPVEPLENASALVTRDETLAAFAARVKMPLEAVAAANKLAPAAKVKKGQSLLVPQALTVTYHGQPVTGDVAPLLIGSTSVTPFRFMFEQQGGKILWNENKQQVTAKSDKYEVTLTVGSDKAIVNKKEELMDMAAFLLSGRTMVPVRFFETALHASVEWEPSTGRLYVASLP